MTSTLNGRFFFFFRETPNDRLVKLTKPMTNYVLY